VFAKTFGHRELAEWNALFKAFFRREISSILFSGLSGAIAACLVRLLCYDRAFESSLAIKYLSYRRIAPSHGQSWVHSFNG
jgi:hypothetical protein